MSGTRPRDAVKDFQKQKGLKIDGAVNPGGKSSATELFLINMIDLLNKEDAALVESLVGSLRKSANHTLDDFTADRIHFVRVDLNGDGVEEFIAKASTSYVCGNSPYCMTSVYTKTLTGLRYIGTIETTGKIGVMGPVITVEDNWNNGWRILNNGRSRYCWLNETDPGWVNRDYVMYFPIEPGQAGYFTSVGPEEECPKRFYVPDE